MTLAPVGIAAFAPTLTMRPPRTTTTTFWTVFPLFGSIIRAARMTVVGPAVAGA